MILGMSTYTFTLLHVVISLIGIVTGVIVLFGMLAGKRLDAWTAIFLATTVLTSVTGFLFPIARIGPPHIVGAISLIALAVAILARYVYRLEGAWRWIYVATAVLSLSMSSSATCRRSRSCLSSNPLRRRSPSRRS
jgi:hypothetical protein